MSNVLIQLGLLLLLILNLVAGYFTANEIMKAASSINSTLLVIAISYVSILNNFKMRG